MNIIDIIEKKRDNKELSKEEIKFFIDNYVSGNIKNYQASSLLMAMYINGLNDEELYDLTIAMANSSKIMDLSSLKVNDNVVVDKHSTGGVGDKVTLIVLSIVACLGVKTFKMSGRGLGITGGTADKLESIKGYKLDIPFNKALKQIDKINTCLISQSKDLAIADKKLYSLRDVTGTVSSIPLIASSIMSKKIACNIDKLVLNVTFGKGSFMSNLDEAKELSNTMINIGKKSGIDTKCVITDMNTPLGHNIGNSLEIEEIIEFLNCKDVNGLNKEIKETVYEIVVWMAILSGKYDSREKIIELIDDVIISGKAYSKFISLIKSQCGKTKVINGIERPIFKDKALYKSKVICKNDGFVTSIDSYNVGKALIELGGSRKVIEDKLDYSVGIKLIKDLGFKVNENDCLMEIYYNDKNKFKNALKYLNEVYLVEEKFENDIKYIYDVI